MVLQLLEDLKASCQTNTFLRLLLAVGHLLSSRIPCQLAAGFLKRWKLSSSDGFAPLSSTPSPRLVLFTPPPATLTRPSTYSRELPAVLTCFLHPAFPALFLQSRTCCCGQMWPSLQACWQQRQCCMCCWSGAGCPC
jgi:hypothetical protein